MAVLSAWDRVEEWEKEKAVLLVEGEAPWDRWGQDVEELLM